ncbi:MAG: hypothetical protein V1834_03405 [Candidatus Micrarchaeota archaeon]
MAKYCVNKCQRCGEDAHVLESCGYCEGEKEARWICRKCIKSSHTGQHKKRKVICKDCWSNTKKKKQFKGD